MTELGPWTMPLQQLLLLLQLMLLSLSASHATYRGPSIEVPSKGGGVFGRGFPCVACAKARVTAWPLYLAAGREMPCWRAWAIACIRRDPSSTRVAESTMAR